MKKFLLLVFFLLSGITTTTTFADAAAETTTVAAANEIDTLEWSISGGPAIITIAGRDFDAYGGGSIQVSGMSIWDVRIKAAAGYQLKSESIYAVGNKIVVYAEISLPDMP